jgi:hypothetical protein
LLSHTAASTATPACSQTEGAREGSPSEADVSDLVLSRSLHANFNVSIIVIVIALAFTIELVKFDFITSAAFVANLRLDIVINSNVPRYHPSLCR